MATYYVPKPIMEQIMYKIPQSLNEDLMIKVVSNVCMGKGFRHKTEDAQKCLQWLLDNRIIVNKKGKYETKLQPITKEEFMQYMNLIPFNLK